MAVLQMQHISICALKKNRKPILEVLQRRGVVELSDLDGDDGVFGKADTASAKSQFEKNATLAAQALEVLDTYVPVKTSMLSMFEGKPALSPVEFEKRTTSREDALRLTNQLTGLAKKIAENKAEIVKRQAQLDALEPWLSLDVSLRFTGTRTTAAFIGSFAEELTLDGIYERLAQQAPTLGPVNIDLISVSREQTCVLAVCHRADADGLEDALRAMGFIRPASPPRQPPQERKALLFSYLETAEKNIQSAENEIISLENKRDLLRFMIDDMGLRAEKYEMIGHLAQSRNAFLLSGYVPRRVAAALEAELTQKYDAAVEISDPAEDADVPVLLQNNSFSAPVEGVLASYSLPGKGEIDPTTIMSFFYYFLFGLMLSDFAYGLMMALGTGILLLKFKGMDAGLRKSMRMFFYCGISTMIWGVIFGSYFGNVVDQVAVTFLGVPQSALPIIPATWFVPLEEPMRMLTFCMGIGLVHLFTGLGINGYLCIKQKRWKDLVANVILWYMLVGGGIVYGLSTDMVSSILQLSPLPANIGSVAGWVAIIGAVGICLTNGTSKNPAVNFAQGLYALYNVTGYLSDLLSYSRLLALGLATGVIGTVINQMGVMGGNGVVGVVMFAAVFLFGHLVNFGINALGAYVHTNRLQYVEFFGKFYEGGGREFSPFAQHTKYFVIEEDK